MSQPKENAELLVEKNNPKSYHVQKSPLPSLGADEVLVRIDKFALTANNLTYVVLGNAYQYFDFFSTPQDKFGRVNVWATGTVTHSRHASLVAGERVYGYFPAAQYQILKPSTVRDSFFYVARDHLPADRKIYNQYFRLAKDAEYAPHFEEQMLVFRPLWWTSFFLDDYLHESKYFGAKMAVVSSASSKTAFCFAHLLKRRQLMPVIGLTSKRNAAFVRKLGCYDSVLEYDELDRLPKSTPFVYCDVAGDTQLQARLLQKCGDQLVKAVVAGLSHWEQSEGGAPTQDKKVQVFFAPEWIKKRREQLGPELPKRQAQAWADLMARADRWIGIRRLAGEKAVSDTYRGLLQGSVDADVGVVLTLHQRTHAPPPPPAAAAATKSKL